MMLIANISVEPNVFMSNICLNEYELKLPIIRNNFSNLIKTSTRQRLPVYYLRILFQSKKKYKGL